MTQQHIPEAKKMGPGDELHLTLLMAPFSLNFFTGQDRQHLLAFGRAAFEAGQAAAQQAVQAAVPDGWKLVPDVDNMTDEQAEAIADVARVCGGGALGIYRAALAAAPAHPAEGVPVQAVLDGGTPGPWRVRKRTNDAGEVLDCFVTAPDCQGRAYDAHILGDDYDRIELKLADAELIVAAVNAYRAIAATQPAAQGVERQKIDPLRQMLAQHAAHLEQNAHAYFELAYTRQTGWMVWITDKPLCSPVVNPDRKVLASGQGDTPEAACAVALATQAKQVATQAKQGENP